MEAYTFRLDVIARVSREDTVERIVKALDSVKSEKYLISLEQSDQVQKWHYQGIVYSPFKENTYKTYMNDAFPEWKGAKGSKKGLRSFAKVKTDNYQIYVTKDGDWQLIKGYTVEEVEALYAQSYQKKSLCNNTEELPITGDAKTFETTLYKLWKKLPNDLRKFGDKLDFGVYVQMSYLKQGKFPLDNYGKMLMNALYVKCGDVRQAFRAAQIANTWLDREERVTDYELRKKYYDYFENADEIIEWDL